MALFIRCGKNVQGHVIAPVVSRRSAAEFEYIDLSCPAGEHLRILLLKPKRTGATGVHGTGFDFVIAVTRTGFRVKGGGAIVVVTFGFHLRWALILAHRQMELSVLN